MEEAEVEVESLLASDSPLIKYLWHRMKGWYKAATNRPPPSARVSIAKMTEERVELYMRIPPWGVVSLLGYICSPLMTPYIR